MISKRRDVKYIVAMKRNKYSYNKDGHRVCGLHKVYDYAFNSRTRPPRSEFNSVIRMYIKLVKKNIIECGRTRIPNIGTFYIVKTAEAGDTIRNAKLEKEYEALYPKRGKRAIYSVLETPSYAVFASFCKGVDVSVTMMHRHSFMKTIQKEAGKNRCVTYKIK